MLDSFDAACAGRAIPDRAGLDHRKALAAHDATRNECPYIFNLAFYDVSATVRRDCRVTWVVDGRAAEAGIFREAARNAAEKRRLKMT